MNKLLDNCKSVQISRSEESHEMQRCERKPELTIMLKNNHNNGPLRGRGMSAVTEVKWRGMRIKRRRSYKVTSLPYGENGG